MGISQKHIEQATKHTIRQYNWQNLICVISKTGKLPNQHMVGDNTINKSKGIIQHEIQDSGYLKDEERSSCQVKAG